MTDKASPLVRLCAKKKKLLSKALPLRMRLPKTYCGPPRTVGSLFGAKQVLTGLIFALVRGTCYMDNSLGDGIGFVREFDYEDFGCFTRFTLPLF